MLVVRRGVGIKIWLGGWGVYWGRFFQVWGMMKLLASGVRSEGGGSLHSPPEEKILTEDKILVGGMSESSASGGGILPHPPIRKNPDHWNTIRT